MSECYRFFGFGPRFINMLETVGNNRRASILLDDCELSRTFDLETGRPQGDNLSPTQYNICQQIPIFRKKKERTKKKNPLAGSPKKVSHVMYDCVFVLKIVYHLLCTVMITK